MGKPEEAASQSRWSRIPAKLKWSIIAITAAVVILALGLGLGLGLTLGGGGGGEDNGALPQPIPNTPTNLQIWQPKVGQSWQIVLLQPINLSPTATTVTPDVDIYDIDLFTNNQSTIDALHRMGKKVICYFSAGSYEPNRPDSDKFTEKDQRKGLEGWPGERWLKLDSANVRSIMSKRIDLAAQKNCDAIDPDNVDGFDNKNGLGLTKADTVNFVSFLATKAQSRGLAIGLKNAAAVIPSVLPAIQFSVNEQCVQYSDCLSFSAFTNASKPVFHIEYPSEVKADFVPNFCGDAGPAAGTSGFSTVVKNMNLDGFVKYCDGKQADTPMSPLP
ncbi:hypothetical protein BLS_008574 [Venturia inaequalis]|uniref:alpha-galactosidase n=1 Tax=Venturia inaequalis TaxID=5025 RepID=A0A8H3U5C0_VENIN|nr:hypothetical protein BLS_008574 [Venturia inaequalis]